jgi:hypothetical protein
MAGPANRRELVRLMVLMEIADDYENLTVSVAGPVVEDGVRCGLTIEKSEIVQALKELVELGWATAWQLGKDSHEFDHMPSLEEMEDFNGAWFYRTEAGLEVIRVSRGRGVWPFDDEDDLRKDWTPPAN